MKKIILIQPPQWYPITPHLAVPLLTGQLKSAGFDATAFDMNVKFFNRILKSEKAKEAEEKAKAILMSLRPKWENADIEKLKATGSYEEQTECLRYITIKKFFEEHGDEIPDITENLSGYVSAMKSRGEFFNPDVLSEAKHKIRLALRLLSMPFAPNELDLDNYFCNPLLNLDWENIKKQVHDEKLNMFIEYTNEVVEKIKNEKYDIVSISLTDLSQLIPVFTLCHALKKNTGCTVVVGGNYATQIHEDITHFSEIFTSYIDFLTIGDGEISLVNLCKYIDGKLPLSDVPNLVYYFAEENKIISTGFSCGKIDMDKVAYPCFSDHDFSDYFIPEPVFTIQLGKGCYWGKCTFCDYFYGQQKYSPKHIDRIIDELKFYISEYGAKHFMFVDEAIPPVFYNKLALAIIDAGLEIYYYSFARLENGFTPEVLENLYKSGARLFLWGYECESLRVMKLMNKGIDAENRMKILTDASDKGIWNDGLFIFGYPTETLEEIQSTMDVIRNNRYIIPSVTLSNFALKKHSLLQKEIGKNGVLDYASNGEFYTVYKDKVNGVEQLERRNLRRSFQFDFLKENAHSLWSVVFSDFDHLLLYLAEYGADYVKNYRSEKEIAPEFR